MRTRFTGVGTALITPFTKDGSLDESAIKRLARRQIDAGVHFLSPCGTTGEAPTLSHRDKLRVVELVVEESNGRIPVLAGAGGYDTREVIELARDMERVGADGLLSVTPYYNKPTQEGLYQHFKAIAESVTLPNRALQRADPHQREHVGRDDAAARGDSEHRRDQGSRDERRALVRRSSPSAREGFHLLERRRSADGGGDGGRRPRRGVGGLERSPGGDGADRRAVREGRLRRRAQAAPLAAIR